MKKSLLRKYAKLLVVKGVNIQKGQDLNIYSSVEQASFVSLIVEEAYKVGARKVRVHFYDEAINKLDSLYQSEEALSTVEIYEKAELDYRVEHLPARLYITSDDPDGMKGIDQEKMSKVRRSRYQILKPYLDKIENKEQWCIAGASSYAWAKKIFPNLTPTKAKEKLWEAILYTSRVTEGDPIKNWEEHNKNLSSRCAYLNSLHLKELHYESSNGTSLKVGLIDDCLFEGGSEKALGSNIIFNPNIPSEECFSSPKRGKAEGIVYATKPLSYQGELIEDFSVRFENGKVIEVKAKKGEELLRKMVSMDEGASQLGEVALIPYNSPINNTGILFYETLFDENASCHLALGAGFTNLIKDYEKYTLDELKEKGINDSMIHVDFMIGSKDMNIVGITKENKEVQIFKDGDWAF